MDRRAFVTTFGGGMLIAPLAAGAQQAGTVPVVGMLIIGQRRADVAATGPRSFIVDTIREGLRELGYIEGHTIRFDIRFAAMKQEAFPALAADLVRRHVDVLVAGGPAAVRAAKDATSTIPIVVVDLESDPVLAGFARTLARPGGNITGCFLDQPGLTGKWLELIREAAPGTRRVAVLVDVTTGPWQLAAIKAAAEKLRIELHILEIRSSGELDHALGSGALSASQALVQLSSPLFDNSGKRISDSAAKDRVPAISMFRSFVIAGGLMSYGPDQRRFYKSLVFYVDKILKGAKPGDLPIEEPTKFDLVINLKTAKALGLTIPPSLLLRADEVIQ